MSHEKLSAAGVITMMIPIVIVGILATHPQYRYHAEDEASLIVSFKRVTHRVKICSEEDIKAFQESRKGLVKHMQKAVGCGGGRERLPLNFTLELDGEKRINKIVQPTGINSDGVTYLYEQFLFKKGRHTVKIFFQDHREGADEPVTTFTREMEFKGREIVVIDYDPLKKKLYIRNNELRTDRHSSGMSISE